MKFYRRNRGRVQSLVALSVCVGMLASLCTPVGAALTERTGEQNRAVKSPDDKIFTVTATSTSRGVLLQWRSKLDADNLGFNIYRSSGGTPLCLNREIIPGAAFVANARTRPSNAHTYSWFDGAGHPGVSYYLEWVSISGATTFVTQPITVTQKTAAANEQTIRAQAAESNTSGASQTSFPAAESAVAPGPNGLLENQWAIAAKPGLKISIKNDGWYRVTQSEMAGAGFSPTVDIRNLRVFGDGQEVAINTSQSIGTFGSTDYIEFYGRGLDTPTADARIYYLIADSVPGKRVGGELHLDSTSRVSSPAPITLTVPVSNGPSWFGFVRTFLNPAQHTLSPTKPNRNVVASSTSSEPKLRQGETLSDLPARTHAAPAEILVTPPNEALVGGDSSLTSNKPAVVVTEKREANTQPANAPVTKLFARKKQVARKAKRRKPDARRYNHAETTSALAPVSFNSTVQLKERFLYYVGALNGDAENFFGRVLSTAAVDQTLTTPNPEFNASDPAKLEIALQGVSFVSHQVNILLNNTPIGSLTYFGQEHPVQTFDVPLSLLQNGANTLTFSPVAGGLVSLVDYARITYPHAFRADSDSLKFNLRGTQSLNVDGFSSPNVRLIDYTDPSSVILTGPAAQVSAAGYSITIPTGTPRKKDQRLLYAIINGQFKQAAALEINQPSTLNLGNFSPNTTGGVDYLIIAHKSLISAVAPLVTARQNQGFKVGVAEVDDVYDEFGYGVHGPHAIKDFLAHASAHWTTRPRYLIFAGDASFDPRNYMNAGKFDLVPTKLVDATYSETASDDWLADFDNDGIADIPVGRLPVRTLAEASLVISKTVNFTPVVPEAALLVADDPGTPAVWDFETSSDDVQALLPASMAVQRVNVRVDGPSQATSNIISGFTQGRAVVNYSGHGNVDVWSGASIFTSANATSLTNGNKLPLVIVMDCLNGYFHDPNLLSLSEAFLLAPNGGAVAAFASSGLTTTAGQRQMELQLYTSLYGSQPIAVGDAIKTAKAATSDIDVRHTWIYFGDPSLKIR